MRKIVTKPTSWYDETIRWNYTLHPLLQYNTYDITSYVKSYQRTYRQDLMYTIDWEIVIKQKNVVDHLQRRKLNGWNISLDNGVSLFRRVVIVMEIKPSENFTDKTFYRRKISNLLCLYCTLLFVITKFFWSTRTTCIFGLVKVGATTTALGNKRLL